MEQSKYVNTREQKKLLCDKESTKTICPKHRNIKQIKRENIWGLCCVLSLTADVINLMLIIAFINVWFYFIAPLVIFVVLTVVLFIYKPTTKYEIKESLSSNKPLEFLSDSKDKDDSKEFPDYGKQNTNKDPQ